jgi:Reverse transcriptase (RNA-dependent DNA polymerase)
VIIVRYADDFIIGFEHETDAKRFLDLLPKRMGKFALALHPEKTRLIEFGRHAAASRRQRGLGKPETFNFLGLTFICGTSRRGRFLIKRKSRSDRMRAKLQGIKQELRQRMHQPIGEQGKWRAAKTLRICRTPVILRSPAIRPTADPLCADLSCARFGCAERFAGRSYLPPSPKSSGGLTVLNALARPGML